MKDYGKRLILVMQTEECTDRYFRCQNGLKKNWIYVICKRWIILWIILLRNLKCSGSHKIKLLCNRRKEKIENFSHKLSALLPKNM